MNSIIKLLTLSLLIIACKKTPPETEEDIPNFNNGLLVLNEGLFQNNNAGCTFYNFSDNQATQNYYLALNSENLGDVGNDMKQYGGKIYIVMNNSNLVNVLSASTGISLTKIPFINGTIGRSPRSINFSGNKAYVCSFDGSLAKIDTSTLTIESIITLGRNPEDLTISNNKIYVSNSGGLDFPNYDTTVSVVDIASFSEIKRINVGMNPGSICTDGQGDVYVIRRGDYGTTPARLFKIDTNLDSVVMEVSNIDMNFIQYSNDKIYYGSQDFVGGSPIIGIFDPIAESISNPNFLDVSLMNTLYGIEINEQDQHIYVMEANNYSSTGDVWVFNFSGTKLYEFESGYLPKDLLKIN